MANEDQKVSVYNYSDYRSYLKDKFSEAKKVRASFSYRSFNRKAGVSSSGFLKLIMEGKRNVASEGMRKIIRGFGLSDKEARYFENLVHFNQSRNHEEKDYYFREMSHNSAFRQAKPLTAIQYNLFSHWYYVVLLELVRMDSNLKKDIHWLARRIKPQVGIRELKKAIKELKKLGLLREEKSGHLVRLEAMLSTPDEVQSVAVANFHIQASELAVRAVKQEPPAEREFSALTSVMSRMAYQRAKKEIQEFRKKIHAIIEEELGVKDRVGHINFQMFLLSESPKGEPL